MSSELKSSKGTSVVEQNECTEEQEVKSKKLMFSRNVYVKKHFYVKNV